MFSKSLSLGSVVNSVYNALPSTSDIYGAGQSLANTFWKFLPFSSSSQDPYAPTASLSAERAKVVATGTDATAFQGTLPEFATQSVRSAHLGAAASTPTLEVPVADLDNDELLRQMAALDLLVEARLDGPSLEDGDDSSISSEEVERRLADFDGEDSVDEADLEALLAQSGSLCSTVTLTQEAEFLRLQEEFTELSSAVERTNHILCSFNAISESERVEFEAVLEAMALESTDKSTD